MTSVARIRWRPSSDGETGRRKRYLPQYHVEEVRASNPLRRGAGAELGMDQKRPVLRDTADLNTLPGFS
jgi:hypothetical protein